MNIAVINLKTFIKIAVKILLLILIAFLIIFLFSKIKINTGDNAFTKCLEKNVNLFSYYKKENTNVKLALTSSILNMGLGNLNSNTIEYKGLKINNKELTIDDVTELENQTNIATTLSDSIITEKVTQNNIEPKSTNTYNGVSVNNQSDYELTEDILNSNMEIGDKKDILIYHTHTCESYTPSPNFEYEATGNYRTTDLNYSVVRVGEEFTKYLNNKGFNVNHNITYHDYPSYSGSYTRSLETIQSVLGDSSTQIVIDLHRDAVGDGASYGPTVKINDKYAAQLMFVMGTDGGGLEHPNWQQNLKFAVKVQEKANEMYPGLFRPIIVRNSRYNQHIRNCACIIEVGATGNTMDQCILSMECLANVFEQVCK